MDPVDVSSLNATDSPLSDSDLQLFKANSSVRYWPKTPFPINEEINKRVVLYDGDIELLRADAFVNPTNETLSQLTLVTKLAGPEIEYFIRSKIRSCATGEVRLTPGFKSNFKHIIHAVPPKYQPKYKTAAETALFHTYFRIMEKMIEKKIRTIVMPTLATSKCNLPIEDNLNLQLRTIRRLLEKKIQYVDKIVIHIQKDADQYTIPFYCYFPRTSIDEEIACHKLNLFIGGPNGEPVIPEREIRIKSKPATIGADDRSIDLTSGLDLSTVVGKTAFSKMHDDLDKQRMNSKAVVPTSFSSQIMARNKNIFKGCVLL